MVIVMMIVIIELISLIRRPSGEEGASAFRVCLPIYKDLRKHVRERVWGADRARPSPGPRILLTPLSPFWRL